MCESKTPACLFFGRGFLQTHVGLGPERASASERSEESMVEYPNVAHQKAYHKNTFHTHKLLEPMFLVGLIPDITIKSICLCAFRGCDNLLQQVLGSL